ncbi:MAG TPA: TetR/AcrR family transcriptional regulator [Acidobacteriaceae bacterium]|nr:TetR/AcrR family transcriptional regulator [Acidobacteriaceae bacterium]
MNAKTQPALPQATAEQIAQVALEILEAEGADAVSMRRVASAVAITPMAIYHHFPNREALLDYIADREFSKLLEYILAHPLRGNSESRVIGVLEGYIDYALARPRIFDYVFSRTRPGARRFPKDFRARHSPTLNTVADVVSAAMAQGSLKKDDVWEVAFALWAHVHGYVMLYRAGRIGLDEKEFRELIHRSLRRFVHGLQS